MTLHTLDELMDLMMKFGRNKPNGFQTQEMIQFLISKGISKDQAIDAVADLSESMEALD